MELQTRPHVYLIVLLAVLVHAFLFQFFGVRAQFVDSQRYIEMADYLISHKAFEYSYQFFYAIPILLLALFRLTFSDGLLAFVVFQSLLSIVAALALFRAATILFRNEKAGIVTAIIFLLWFDCIQWNTAIMTESLASTLMCLIILLVVIFNGTRKHFFLLALLLLAMVMTRPTGVLAIAGAVVFLLTRYHSALDRRPVAKSVTYVFLAIVFTLGGFAMLNEWDFTDQYERGNIVTYMDVLKGDALYDATLRLDTTNLSMPDPSRPPAEKVLSFIIDNPLHFAKAAALKMFYVVTFYRPYFSTMHNLYTLFWLSSIYVCLFFGLRYVESRQVRNFAVTVIVANCLLVGLSAADWDNRFYMPMQPCIVLLAGGGGARLWHNRNARVQLPRS